jgi:signal transduction histidine kinase
VAAWLGRVRRRQPRLDALPSLIDDVRAAGPEVRLHVQGTAVDLPPSLDLSAYRILQEGVTNALKHADARHVDVAVTYDARQVTLEVRDDGRGPAATDGLGHGLVGIRERVKIYGGEMSAGTAETGGFVLRAKLPLDG